MSERYEQQGAVVVSADSPTLVDTKEVVRIDRNFGDYPIFVSSQYRGKSREITVTEKHKDGSINTRRLTIGKSPKGTEVGVLYPTHAKVFYILLKRWQDRGKPVGGPVFCSRYAICKKLGWTWNNRTSKCIEGILRDLRFMPIMWENSFWRAQDQSYSRLLADFSILSYLLIQDVKKGEKEISAVQFEFNKLLLENLGKVYSFPLRLDVVVRLKKDISVLLYPYVERVLAHRKVFERDLADLWDELGLSKNYIRFPSDYKTKIAPALEELEGKLFYWGSLAYARVESKKDGSGYKVVFGREHPLPKEAGTEQIQEQRQSSHNDMKERRPLNRYERKVVTEALKRLGGDASKYEAMMRRHGLDKFKAFILQR